MNETKRLLNYQRWKQSWKTKSGPCKVNVWLVVFVEIVQACWDAGIGARKQRVDHDLRIAKMRKSFPVKVNGGCERTDRICHTVCAFLGRSLLLQSPAHPQSVSCPPDHVLHRGLFPLQPSAHDLSESDVRSPSLKCLLSYARDIPTQIPALLPLRRLPVQVPAQE